MVDCLSLDDWRNKETIDILEVIVLAAVEASQQVNLMRRNPYFFNERRIKERKKVVAWLWESLSFLGSRSRSTCAEPWRQTGAFSVCTSLHRVCCWRGRASPVLVRPVILRGKNSSPPAPANNTPYEDWYVLWRAS